MSETAKSSGVPSRLLLSAQKTAAALSICAKTLWTITAPRGDLPCVKIGRRVLYDPRDLQAWIDEKKGGGRPTTDTQVELLLSKLPDAKPTGKGWSARCPAHDDRRLSLSIAAGDDGRALVRCPAGCTPAAICDALGLRLADLMPHGGAEKKGGADQ